jgi:hypothetical protein
MGSLTTTGVNGPPTSVRSVVGPPQGTSRTASFSFLVGLTVSTLDKLINGYKWSLLARSMSLVRGHTYKKSLRISIIRYTRNSSLNSLLPPFLVSSVDKPRGEFMISLIVMSWIHVTLVLNLSQTAECA